MTKPLESLLDLIWMLVGQHERGIIIILFAASILMLVLMIVLIVRTSSLKNRIATLEVAVQRLANSEETRKIKELKLNSLLVGGPKITSGQ